MSKDNSKDEGFSLLIHPDRTGQEYFKDLYRYRELFYFLAWRDIRVRYKQTLLGVLWALIRPLLNMAVFVLIFGKIAHLGSDQVAYPLFVLAGMIPWQLFANCLIDTSDSLISHAPMISKVYFPRLLLPASDILVQAVDFFISFSLLFILFFFTGYLNHWSLLALPLLIGLTFLLCLGAGLWLAALTVRYRDFRFIVPFLVQFGLFLSPVGYSSFLIPETWRWLYFLNPMAGIIEGFRWCCFETSHPDLPFAIGLSSLITLGILLSGVSFFRKMERVLADIL